MKRAQWLTVREGEKARATGKAASGGEEEKRAKDVI